MSSRCSETAPTRARRGTLTLKAVILDHSALLVDDELTLRQMRTALTWMASEDLPLVVFSTHGFDIEAETRARGLPPPEVFLTRGDVEANKGSDWWVWEAAAACDIAPNEFLYVGDDKFDCITAMNAGTFYMHAGWRGDPPEKFDSLVAENPLSIPFVSTHLLMPRPRWEYRLDDADHGVRLRALLDANTRLPATSPAEFRLQEVFKHETKVKVEENSARDVLGLHAFSSLYAEGLIPPNSYFGVYPSSQPGKVNKVLAEFVRGASRMVHGFYKPDLLIRSERAADTSLERYHARQEGRLARVDITTQASTVHLNPKHRKAITKEGRTVVIWDDFTTSGMSLDWARNLLRAAGVQNVVLVAIGKYPKAYSVYVPVAPDIVVPFRPRTYSAAEFTKTDLKPERDLKVAPLMRASFGHWAKDRSLPPLHYRDAASQ